MLEELTNYLKESHSADELRQLAMYHLGPTRAAGLPSELAGLDEFAYRFALLCRQNEQIDDALFARLVQLRPGKRQAIDALQRRARHAAMTTTHVVAPPRRSRWSALLGILAGATAGYLVAILGSASPRSDREDAADSTVACVDPTAVDRCALSLERLPRDTALAQTQAEWKEVVDNHRAACAPLLARIEGP